MFEQRLIRLLNVPQISIKAFGLEKFYDVSYFKHHNSIYRWRDEN